MYSALLAAAGRRANGGGDPYWPDVVSLLNFQGPNGSTTFTDATGKIWTPDGNAQISTADGFPAGDFDAASGISTPDGPDFEPGAGDWTIDLWIKPGVLSGYQGLYTKWGTGVWSWGLYLNGNVLFLALAHGSGGGSQTFFTGTSTLTTGVYQHVAAVRSGNNIYLFNGGALDAGSGAYSQTIIDTSATVRIGRDEDAYTLAFNGRIRAARRTNVARWTSSFTPPPPPFPTS